MRLSSHGNRLKRPPWLFEAIRRTKDQPGGCPEILTVILNQLETLRDCLSGGRFVRRHIEVEGETPSGPAGRRRCGSGKLLESSLIGHGRVEVQIRGVNQQVQVHRVRRVDAYRAGTLDAYAMDHDALFGYRN